MKIFYSKDAIDSLREIVDFLNEHWTSKEIETFSKDLDKFFDSLRDKIISYPYVYSDTKLQYAFLGKKQVKLYFDLYSDHVEILLFFPSKGNPENLKKLFNL